MRDLSVNRGWRYEIDLIKRRSKLIFEGGVNPSGKVIY